MTSTQCIENGNFEESYNKWLNANRRWKDHWFDTCVEIFNRFKEWAKKFVIDPIAKTIKEVVFSPIVWNCEQIDYPEKTELCYLIKCLDANGEPIFSKIGTTTRTVVKRMKEHLRNYRDLGVKSIEIDRVYDCGNRPAEGFESEFRGKYISKYPTEVYKKNDRFFGVLFDLVEADEIAVNYRNSYAKV